MSDSPMLYVGTYAKYNNGSIEGAWLKLSDYMDAEEFYEACNELHADEEDLELMFQDFDGFPRELYSEAAGLNDLEKIFEYIEYCKKHGQEFIDALLCELDFDELEDAVDNTYYLCDSTFGNRDYNIGEAFIEEIGGIENLDEDTLKRYFDYEAYGRELQWDIRVIISDGKIYYTYR